jgi:hypothetical protein
MLDDLYYNTGSLISGTQLLCVAVGVVAGVVLAWLVLATAFRWGGRERRK